MFRGGMVWFIVFASKLSRSKQTNKNSKKRGVWWREMGTWKKFGTARIGRDFWHCAAMWGPLHSIFQYGSKCLKLNAEREKDHWLSLHKYSQECHLTVLYSFIRYTDFPLWFSFGFDNLHITLQKTKSRKKE